MTLAVIGHDFAYEMECVARIFYAGEQINIEKVDNFTDADTLETRVNPLDSGMLRVSARVKTSSFDKSASEEIVQGDDELCERRLGVMLFTLLCELTGKRPEWGIMTGIRPVSLCGRWAKTGMAEGRIVGKLVNDYLVSFKKARLCVMTNKAQEKYLELNKPDTFSLYIGIPFCPTRCLYCSFVSHAIDKTEKLVPPYVDLLCEEIRSAGELAKRIGKKLLTIYVGGGTPTSLSAEQLGRVLSAVKSAFDLSGLLEYSVEAGRPDTVTAKKLAVFRSFGVTRVSINPQSMNDNVLKAIGRAHTAAQVEESFMLAREAGFAVNMDIISGLPEETPESFAKSLEKIISLSPDNVTVHTLAVKRSSGLRDFDDAFTGRNPHTGAMQDYAQKCLVDTGYMPYYLYRQKASVENLENVGYSKPGFEGIYNIFSMEDTHNILAVGAGGVSKLVESGRIRRLSNYKYPYEYISRFEEILKRKDEVK